LAEDIGIYDDLTIKQSLHYAASLHLMSKEDASQSIYKLTTALAITDRLDVKLSALSKGLKQSVAIAQAIIHNPSVILLDEPSSGLDPEARHRVISLFGQLQGNGATLLISTHVLSEIESYCSDILIIKDGRLLKFDDMNQDLPDSTLLKLKMSEGLASTVNMLKSNPNISRIEKITGGVQFYFTGNKEQQAELLNHLVAVNATISSFEVVCKNLQDKYLASIRKDKGL
jgi:ABC-2 type transport system ATP-binding protein